VRRDSAESPEAAGLVLSRERRLAERFLEDEALRGDLDDATWQPLQDWLLAVIRRLAASTEGLGDDAAQPILDAGQARLRQIVAELADVLSDGTGAPKFAERLAAVAERLEPPLVEPTDAASMAAALRAAAQELASTQADGPTAAGRLVAMLTGAGSATQEEPGEQG
jgi:hypothetical protein